MAPACCLIWTFNAAQVAGFDNQPMAPAESVTPLPSVGAQVSACGADPQFGGSEVYYHPSTDRIHLPPPE